MSDPLGPTGNTAGACPWCGVSHRVFVACTLDDLRRQIARNRSELADRDAWHKAVMAEDCGDARHCTCVPELRRKLDEARTLARTLASRDSATVEEYERHPWLEEKA